MSRDRDYMLTYPINSLLVEPPVDPEEVITSLSIFYAIDSPESTTGSLVLPFDIPKIMLLDPGKTTYGVRLPYGHYRVFSTFKGDVSNVVTGTIRDIEIFGPTAFTTWSDDRIERLLNPTSVFRKMSSDYWIFSAGKILKWLNHELSPDHDLETLFKLNHMISMVESDWRTHVE